MYRHFYKADANDEVAHLEILLGKKVLSTNNRALKSKHTAHGCTENVVFSHGY